MKIFFKSFFMFFIFMITIEALIKFNGTVIANIVAVLLYITLIFLLYRIYKKSCLRNNQEKYSNKKIVTMIILSCIIFICVYLAENGLLYFFIPDYTSKYNFKPMEIVNCVIFAPIAEELLCRGIMLQQLMKKHSFLMANLIQASLFGILHDDIKTFIFLFLVGIVLGLVSKYLDLFCSIIIHSLNNLVNTFLLISNIKTFELQRWEYLLEGVVFFTITAYLLNRIKTFNQYDTNQQ